MDPRIEKALSGAQTYAEYRLMIDSLLEEGKTTGPVQSDDFLHYTKLNVTRMKRLDKTSAILDAHMSKLQGIKIPQKWLVITEAWCGDAAQVIPVIESMAALNDKVSTHYILRDEHVELIDMYLTKGGRSIPKILLIDIEKNEVYGSWGPRPSALQEMIDLNKAADRPKPYSELAVDVQRWYAKDKTLSTQREFASVVR